MTKDVTTYKGFEFEPFQFVVERGKIREFVTAIGDDNPIYFDKQQAQEAGFADVPIPPTFPTVIEMWSGMDFFRMVETLQVNPLKVLHGEQEYGYFGEVYPGDELTVQIRVADAITKHGKSGSMNLFTLETSYTNQREELVIVARSIVIERF